jgi:hypothetical protein
MSSACYAQISADSLSNNDADTLRIVAEDEGLDEQVFYNAKDSTVLDLVNNRVLLYGQAEVIYGELSVKADFIEYLFQEQTAKARGKRDALGRIIEKAHFKEGDNGFDEDSLAYNFKNKKGITYGVITQEGEAFLHSTISKKAENNWVSIGQGKFTTCAHPNPHYYFNLKRAMVIPNEKIVSGPIYPSFRKPNTKHWPGLLQLGAFIIKKTVHVPKIGLPFGFFPNKKESAHGILIPGYGNADQRGYFLQNLGYFIPLGKYADTKFLFDVYSRGSWSMSNQTNYKRIYKYSGSFQLSQNVLKDGLPELPSSYSERKTFNIQWRHTQDPKAKPNTTFSANVNMGSTSYFRNNLNTSQDDFVNSTFTSSINYGKVWLGTPFNMGVNAGHTQNTQSQKVQVNLPTVAINMSRINLGRFVAAGHPMKRILDLVGLNAGADFANTITEQAVLFRLDQLDTLKRLSKSGIRMNSALTMSLPFKKYGTATITANGDFVGALKYLKRQQLATPDGVRLDTINGFLPAFNWNAQANYNFRLYGTFNFLNAKKIRAIRHVIQSNVGASYTPYLNYSENYFDQSGNFVGYTAFDAAQYRPSSTQEAFNVNFGINQNVEAKIKDVTQTKLTYKKVKLIESWRTSISHNVLADSLQWSNVGMSAFTTIAQKITLNYSSSYSLYDRDSTGREVNDLLMSRNRGFWRMEGTNVAIGWRLKSSKKNKGERADDQPTPAEQEVIDQNRRDLIDFSTPWTFNFNYNVRIEKRFDKEQLRDTLKLTQGVTFSGDFTFLKVWAVSVQSGYDLSAIQWANFDKKAFGLRDFTTTTIGLHCDLHCWEFSLNYVPFGIRQSYVAQLNIKSSMLKDVKIQRRGNFGNLYY